MNEIRISIMEGKNEKEHTHQEIELIYILEGSFLLELTGDRYLLEKNDIILVNSNKIHSCISDQSCLICKIYIDYRFITKSTEKHFVRFWCNSLIDKDEDYNKIKYILNNIIKEWKINQGRDTFLLKSQKYSLAACLVRDFMLSGEEKKGEIEDERVERIIKYIDMHYTETISLRQIAAEIYMSESAVSRLFKKVTGRNFVEYVNSVRMNYAIEDLLYTSKNITEIACECGFSTPSAFNKLFHRSYNCSPTVYQRKMKESIHRVKEEERLLKEHAQQRLDKWVNERKGSADVLENITELAVDNEEIRYEYQRECCKCVDFGMAADLLQGSVQKQLAETCKGLNIGYIRIGGFFHPTMYLQMKRGMEKYNFTHIDTVLDFITEQGIYPIIDLSYHRFKRTFEDIGKILYDDEDEIDGIDLEEYEKMLEATIWHLMSRYGEENIVKWYFTLENDERYRSKELEQREDYCFSELWKRTFHVIKTVCPEIKVGGDIGLLTLGIEKTEVPDLFTMRIYPYVKESRGKEVYSKRTTDSHFVLRSIMKCKRELEHYGISGKILVTEWNTSISERNSYNDSCAKAAHIMTHMFDMIGLDVMLCYHQGSDYLCQYRDTSLPLMGASGMITKAGIAKPIWFTFLFMSQLYPYILNKGEHYLIVRSKSWNFQLLFCNAKNFGHTYYLKPESEIRIENLEEIFENTEDENYHVTINNIVDGNYRIKKEVLKVERGNIQKEWQNMGCMESLGKEEIEYLKCICRPVVYSEEKKVENGRLTLRQSLKAHEIVRITITKEM